MVASWVAVQSTWLEIELDGIFKRVHFSRERERDPRRERNSRGIQEDRAFKRVQEGEGMCPGYLPSAFRHPPMVVLTN